MPQGGSFLLYEGKAGDDFWVKAETLLYCALIGYIHYEAPVEEQNFSTLIEFINAMEVREDDEEFKNPVDLMFDTLEAEKPNHFAVRQYKKYKLAAGKTAKSILISCGARLAVFDIAELREVTAYDELELDTLGDRKTALFLIMSDTDDSFNFLISMCYTQLFNLLCEKADDVYGGRLPVHVRCLIDEAANIGQIPRLEKLVATIRSREISACLVLQAQSQLKAIYKDNADTIIGNMDTSIFLGGKEPTTLKELAAVLGKETIDTYNTGESRGRETSHSLNYQKLGKEIPVAYTPTGSDAWNTFTPGTVSSASFTLKGDGTDEIMLYDGAATSSLWIDALAFYQAEDGPGGEENPETGAASHAAAAALLAVGACAVCGLLRRRIDRRS